MKKRKIRFRSKGMTKKMLAMIAAVCMFAGTSVTASAETVVWDYKVGGL